MGKNTSTVDGIVHARFVTTPGGAPAMIHTLPVWRSGQCAPSTSVMPDVSVPTASSNCQNVAAHCAYVCPSMVASTANGVGACASPSPSPSPPSPSPPSPSPSPPSPSPPSPSPSPPSPSPSPPPPSPPPPPPPSPSPSPPSPS